jgi:glucose-1-phosphate adenylyltransferase
MQNMVAVILGGGKGSRLFPLTRDRAKPAVPLAGKYRLIDIAVSNCINSGVRQMYVLTMYQSASLNKHLLSAYRFDGFSDGFVDVLAAEQTRASEDWFQGTADAVRQSMIHINNTPARNVLILSGDQLYRMDYNDFEHHHNRSRAEITIAVKPVGREEAWGFGLLKTDRSGRIVQFTEKPKTDEELDSMRVDTTVFGLTTEQAERRPFLASMGIYLFKPKTLNTLLMEDLRKTDFGRHIIPSALEGHKVQAYCFRGYWADIGTVHSFYEANMDLIRPLPKFNLFDPEMPIYSHSRFLPGAKLNQASVKSTILCDGTIVDEATVHHSILGVRAVVQSGADIEYCMIMGADFYQSGLHSRMNQMRIGIGEDAHIRRAIVDKNAAIGKGVRLLNEQNHQEYDDPNGLLYVRDGIIVVPKGAVIPDGFVF